MKPMNVDCPAARPRLRWLNELKEIKLDRKKILLASGASAGLLALAGLATYLYASRVESRRYQLEKLRMRLSPQSDALVKSVGGERAVKAKKRRGVEHEIITADGVNLKHPLRILHISDLHLAHPETHKIDFLRRATDQDLDLVLLTGDIFENYTGLAYAASILSRAPRLGAYAVLGNHDYYDYTWFHKIFGRMVRKYRNPRQKRDVAPMVEALEAGGFTVLRNSAVTLKREKVHIVGVDYPGIEEEDLQTLVSQAPEDNLVITLFHLPKDLEQYEKAGVHLAVGGHTHGGQIRIPGYGAIITDSELPRGEASGVFFRGDTAFHISRGVGADPKTNFRLFCPPAATLIEIK